MKKQISVSIIVPVYNGKPFIKHCLDGLLKQDLVEPYEIIIVDDASTDNTKELIQSFNFPNLSFFSLSSNLGQSAARNVGLRKAVGKYVYFQDVDDTIATNALTMLYDTAKQNDCDFVCSDYKQIENSKNQRDGKYNYPSDMVFNNNELIQAMRRELHDPSLGHLGLFGCNGRLIRRSIIIDNNILFEEQLRWHEDTVFCWDVLGFVRSARYIRKQLYSYYVYPNIQSAIIEGIIKGFPLEYIKLVNSHVIKGLKQRGVSKEEIEKLAQQGLVFHSIQVLVSISRSMFLGKIEFEKGKNIRRDIINEIVADPEVLKAIKNYLPSEKESKWIPRAISIRSRLLLEYACDFRAKEILKRRRKRAE